MPVLSISEYLKKAKQRVESLNEVKITECIMIDGRNYSVDGGNIRIPRVIVITSKGIEVRSIRSISLFDKIKEEFERSVLNQKYPVLRLKEIGNTVIDVELTGKGVDMEKVIVKIRELAEKHQKYYVYEGEGTFFWRGEQAIIEGSEPVYLPARLLSPAVFAEVVDGKRIRYMLNCTGIQARRCVHSDRCSGRGRDGYTK